LNIRRWAKSSIAKLAFFTSIVTGLWAALITISSSCYSGVNDAVSPTRISVEVMAEAQTYLQAEVHYGLKNLNDQESSCRTVYQDQELKAEYLDARSAKIHP
jgi:hypothetical protein